MAEPTTYIVLRRRQENKDFPAVWEVVSETDGEDVPWVGPNASAAIRKSLVGLLPGDKSHEGTYVAVPARSWKPVTVRAEQQVVLKLEDAAG